MWRRMSDIFLAIVIQAFICLILLLVTTLRNHNGHYLFLIYNLFLAWIPLFFTLILKRTLNKHSWLGWRAILITFFWLLFLPNSFYIFTDLIHLQSFSSVDALFDIVTILLFAINGAIIGMISLYWVHKELIKRLGNTWSGIIITLIIIACSFAIYLGRYLRWNSWDILLNPLTLLFYITNPFFETRTQSETFSTTLVFASLIGSCYIILLESYKHISFRTKS